jgi:hypothetical protein
MRAISRVHLRASAPWFQCLADRFLAATNLAIQSIEREAELDSGPLLQKGGPSDGVAIAAEFLH